MFFGWYVIWNLYIYFVAFFNFFKIKLMTTYFDMVKDFLSYSFFGNSLYIIVWAILLFFVIYLGLKLIMKYIHKKVKIYTKWKQETWLIVFLNLIRDLPRWFFLAIEIYIPLQLLNSSNTTDCIIDIIFFFILTLVVINIVVKVLIFVLSTLFEKKSTKDNKAVHKTINLVVNIVVWIVGIFMFLTNVWVDLTPLIASLGVASIAVAFALQNILTDLFSSFSIIISKPFVIWDYVVIWEGSQERSWTVKNITLKATHLLSTYWQEVVIPNSNVLSTEVINYGRMTHRRKRFTIWVVYETSKEKLKDIPNIIKDVITKNEFSNFEWAYLSNLSAYSIDFYISYDILETDYVLSLDVHEKVLLWLFEAFEKKWIHFAYPTQTIYTHNLK